MGRFALNSLSCIKRGTGVKNLHLGLNEIGRIAVKGEGKEVLLEGIDLIVKNNYSAVDELIIFCPQKRDDAKIASKKLRPKIFQKILLDFNEPIRLKHGNLELVFKAKIKKAMNNKHKKIEINCIIDSITTKFKEAGIDLGIRDLPIQLLANGTI